MQVIKLEDRVIYRAAKGRKVKFRNKPELYSEIIVKLDDEREVEEVKE